MQKITSTDLDQDLKRDIENFGDFNQATIENQYDNLASKYELMMTTMGHPDPGHCGDAAVELLAGAGLDITKVKALDMGCGTGMVGEELAKRRIADITGIDASSGMLEESRKKGCYTELVQMFLGKPETFPENLRNQFDLVTAAAILAEGHLTGGAIFEEFLLSLKQGGFVIFTTREEYLTKYGYAPVIEHLNSQGKWKKVKEFKFQKYHNIQEGDAIGRFQAKDTMLFAYQKL